MQTVLGDTKTVQKNGILHNSTWIFHKISELLPLVLSSQAKGKPRRRNNVYPGVLGDLRTEKQF